MLTQLSIRLYDTVCLQGVDLKQLDHLVMPIPEDPDNVTRPMVSALRDELATFLQRANHPDAQDKEKLVESVLNAILVTFQSRSYSVN